jgi:hypothetical protein
MVWKFRNTRKINANLIKHSSIICAGNHNRRRSMKKGRRCRRHCAAPERMLECSGARSNRIAEMRTACWLCVRRGDAGRMPVRHQVVATTDTSKIGASEDGAEQRPDPGREGHPERARDRHARGHSGVRTLAGDPKRLMCSLVPMALDSIQGRPPLVDPAVTGFQPLLRFGPACIGIERGHAPRHGCGSGA